MIWQDFEGVPYNGEFSLRIINKLREENPQEYQKVLQMFTALGWTDVHKTDYHETDKIKAFAQFLFEQEKL